MKLKYKFVIQKLGDKYAAVTVEEDAGKFNGMLRVNELGKIILTALQSGTDRSSLSDLMKDQFEDAAEMDRQIDAFLVQLKQSDLLIQ